MHDTLGAAGWKRFFAETEFLVWENWKASTEREREREAERERERERPANRVQHP